MTVSITDNRTLVDAADSATGWASDGGGSNSLITTDPEEKESSGHIGKVVSNTENDLHHVHSSTDLSSGILVYIWAFGQGIINTAANNGMSAYLGDSAGQSYAYETSGSDVAVFRHSSGSAVNYQCILIDTGSLPTGTLKLGSGAIDLTIITKFGVNFYTTAKAVGGVVNSFIDVIRYGNGGLTITGTETLTVLEEIASRDAGQTSGDSFGIVRDIGGGIFGVQGQLLFGYTSATANETISIQDQTLAFENFSGVGTDKFGLTFQGNSTDTQTFTIDNSTLFSPSGSGAFLTANDVDVSSFDLTNSSILNFDQTITLCTDATNGPNHDISNNLFKACAMIDPGKTAFQDNVIDSTVDANGGFLIDSAVSLTNISGLSFVSDGAGHAIEITATGSYTFTGYTYSGYGATATTDAVVRNDSGGAVTITVSGGDTPTYLNIGGATTSVISSVPINITVLDGDDNNNPINLAQTAVFEDNAGVQGAELMNEDTNASGFATEPHTGATPQDVFIRVRKSSSGTQRYFDIDTAGTIVAVDGLTTTIVMKQDNIASA